MTNTVATWRRIKGLHKELGKSGKIVVWTKIYVAPEGFSQQVPYIVAIISFGKEKRTLQLVDYEEDQLQLGQQVITVVRRIGSVGSEDIISYGLKAKPV
jgi:scaffold protein (connect acetoacetyl-CoA thiolase and HMG-CoA synthase)